VHINAFFATKNSEGDTIDSKPGCLDTYPGYGWGMTHLCLTRVGVAMIQDEAPGGYKGRGTVGYYWIL